MWHHELLLAFHCVQCRRISRSREHLHSSASWAFSQILLLLCLDQLCYSYKINFHFLPSLCLCLGSVPLVALLQCYSHLFVHHCLWTRTRWVAQQKLQESLDSRDKHRPWMHRSITRMCEKIFENQQLGWDWDWGNLDFWLINYPRNNFFNKLCK